MNLNPHKPKNEPLPPAPPGMIWHGVKPELITIEEHKRRITEMFEKRAQRQHERSQEKAK